MSGRVVSLQVGQPAPLAWGGVTVMSAILKAGVEGPVRLRADGFDGDRQGDPTVHGGPDKAACCYPSEHVPDWAARLGVDALPGGAFGENLTLAGLLERDVRIGDVFRLGGAIVQVSQPRGPCFKLAARWGVKALPAWMAREARSGFYLRVLEEGDVAPGDAMTLAERGSDVSVADVMRVTYAQRDDDVALARAIAVPELAEQWRDALRRLAGRAAVQLDE